MNEIKILKEQDINTLLKRIETILDPLKLKALANPVIVSTTIVDMNAVVRKIKETWTIFNIKDVRVNLKSQKVYFRVYGKCYIPKECSAYVIMKWSETQTEECNYLKEIKEKYAEENSLPIFDFINHGIKVEIV